MNLANNARQNYEASQKYIAERDEQCSSSNSSISFIETVVVRQKPCVVDVNMEANMQHRIQLRNAIRAMSNID